MDETERRRLKRVVEETFEEGEREHEIKRLKADRKELMHLKQVMKE